MTLIDNYIIYVSAVRRYSSRTCDIYRESLAQFCKFISENGFVSSGNGAKVNQKTAEVGTGAKGSDTVEKIPDNELISCLTRSVIRSYEVHLLEEKKMVPRTVNLHLSVLSGFCKYLVKGGQLASNPVKTVTRPKEEKRLPEFYRAESIDEYFLRTDPLISEEFIYQSPEPGQTQTMYDRRLRRLIVSMLFCTGMRRSELIGLKEGDVDFSRKVVKVHGKGDKMREIPLVDSLLKEISLYLRAAQVMLGIEKPFGSPLLLTYRGTALYPVYVDRAVKQELGEIGSITGRKSPHVLRHTLATELLNEGTDLNYIKQLLGHSSLAATQVYTHNSVAKLKKVYESAHPRAKNGGKNGD